MKPIGHLAISVIGSSIIFGISKNLDNAAVFFISNILIDIDHIFDYFRSEGISFVSLRQLNNWCYDRKNKRLVLIFHSYELLFIFWTAIIIFKPNPLWIWSVLGFTVHLISDQFFNPVFAPSYFFVYRYKKKFRTENLFYR